MPVCYSGLPGIKIIFFTGSTSACNLWIPCDIEVKKKSVAEPRAHSGGQQRYFTNTTVQRGEIILAAIKNNKEEASLTDNVNVGKGKKKQSKEMVLQ